MAQASAQANRSRRLPPSLEGVIAAVEPLWLASLAALFVVGGYTLLPRAIQLLGRAGQTETVEWAIYMSLLAGFPLAVLTIALAVPRLFGNSVQTFLKAGAIGSASLLALFAAAHGRLGITTLGLVAAIGSLMLGRQLTIPSAGVGSRTRAGVVTSVVVGTIAWVGSGALVYWARGSDWFLGSAWRIGWLVVATFLAARGLPRFGEAPEARTTASGIERALSLLVGGGLVVFCFRTNPMIEFYHWGFWTGPIEQLRQGGWLLYDTPSQYGFLSILTPTALPGSAWESFWFFQGLIYAIVALAMFVVFRRLRGGVLNVLFAGAVVFTTLFFRPRTADLILASQMTPSGGPVRFVWCFALLAYLLHAHDTAKSSGGGGGFWKYPMPGHVIWLFAVAWSFEAAIYCTAIWFSAFAVHLLQQGAADLTTRSRSAATRRLVAGVVTPLAMAVALYAVVWVVYHFRGLSPDMAGYVEYGLLYSRGFGALPIAPSGSVWYLLTIFFVASTVAGLFLVDGWRDFRLQVAAGAWGGVWSLSSYFVSRSHPVNLLSIAPVLLFTLAVLAIVIAAMPRSPWHAYIRSALIPLFAVPVALSLGHPGIVDNVRVRQLAPGRLVQQVPLMDATLEALMRESGVQPTDAIVRIADGRLVLPAWRGQRGEHVMSARSWLPKPYEIIGTLGPERRQVYIDRDAREGLSGWMIQHQSDTVRWFDQHLEQIMRTHQPVQKLERGPWRLWRMVPRSTVAR
ncbi:MAG: hypothetical protein ABIS03_01685 [Gemmatimonadaceae bacterium]